ncbi:hypothetical protein PybrP1_006604 [[Pythium] brassicae (nom. inval.)]|nr:hypothetical protein PybrP1_006604 [[Pythium] brassicae (nom. inval.)]
MVELPLEAPPIVTLADDEDGRADAATVALNIDNEPTSFQELHAARQRPWHERAYVDGPRPVPRPKPSPLYWRNQPVEVRAPAQPPRDSATKAVRCARKCKPKRKRQRAASLPKLCDVDWTQRDTVALDAVKRRLVTDYAHCLCVQCTILQREQQAAPAFRCPVRHCGVQFGDDVVALLEHQVGEHGRVFPHCRRVRMELFGQERGAVPYPPVTVFIGQQVLHPGFRPTEWPLARVDDELRTLRQQLFDGERRRRLGALHVWDAFILAYHQVRQGGPAQLRAQYEAALEYYQSALVHPVTTRCFPDGSGAVGGGRNWLRSPELEHAAQLTPFRFELERDEEDTDIGSADTSGAGDGPASLLLLETGERVQGIKTSVTSAAVAATAAKLSGDAVGRHSDAGPWYQPLLERPDARVAAGIKGKGGLRTRKARRRCGDCGCRIDYRSHVCKPSLPREPGKPRCCRLCGVAGHTKITCPDKDALALTTGVTAALRCGNCGLFGHTRKTCYQPVVVGGIVTVQHQPKAEQ